MDLTVPDGRERLAWVTVGLVTTAVVVYVASTLVGAVVVGLFLYYAVRPAVRWLDDRLHYPRINATLALLLVGLPLLLVLGYATLVGLRELDQFLGATNLDQLRSAVRPYLGSVEALDRQAVIDLLRGNLSRVGGAVWAIGGWLLRIFVAVTVAYYLLRDDEKMSAWYRESFADHPAAIDFAEGVDEDLTTLYTGNLITIFATGLVAVAVFYGLGLVAPGSAIRYPVLLGLVVGVSTLIPAVGMKIVYFPYTAYLVWQTQMAGGPPLWFPAVFFLVTLLVVDSFPDIFVRSYVSSGDYNMGLVMLAYVLGATAFGWYGVFLAPVVLVVFLHFTRDVLPQLV